jgi:hypothetical protein
MGKHLNTAAKDLLVTMSEKMATRDISDVTGVAEQTLQRLLANPAGSAQPPTFCTQRDPEITFHSHKKILMSENVFVKISVSVVYLLDHSCA